MNPPMTDERFDKICQLNDDNNGEYASDAVWQALNDAVWELIRLRAIEKSHVRSRKNV